MDDPILCFNITCLHRLLKLGFNFKALDNPITLNLNFNNLCKQVMLKHNIGSSMSPEMQLLMITTTTIYMTIQKNQNKSQIDQYLNQKI